MFAKLVVIVLVFSQIRGNDHEAEIPLSGAEKELELDELFRGLTLSNQIGDTTNYTHKETIGGQGYVDDCLSFDPISIDISFNHIKMHLFYDNFTQSRTIRYQIRCYLKSLVFAKRISIKEIRLGPLMHNDSIVDESDCEKLKKVIGKSSKNEMYFIITGTPKKCDNFIGLGIFVMLNPMPNGRPYPFKNNNQFREFKKDMIKQIEKIMNKYMADRNLKLASNKFTYRKLVEGDNEPEPLLERSLQENFYTFSIKSHFTSISEIVEMERYYDNEWLMENDIKRALKYLFSFVVSQYKENIGVVDDKSSEPTLISQSDSLDNGEYESWIMDHAVSLIPLTLILGAVIASMTFFIHKRSNDAYRKKKKAIFNQGIQVLHDIRKEMDQESEMTTDSESVTTETSTY